MVVTARHLAVPMLIAQGGTQPRSDFVVDPKISAKICQRRHLICQANLFQGVVAPVQKPLGLGLLQKTVSVLLKNIKGAACPIHKSCVRGQQAIGG